MKKNILYLMGNPNVGKSTLLLEFRKDPRFFVPKHVTNRKKREDDDDFYRFVEDDYFFKNDMFISIKDSKNIIYGVTTLDFNNCRDDNNKIVVINCSIKNLDTIKIRDKDRIVIILTKDIKKRLNSKKYSEKEKIYRYNEAIKEGNIIKKYENKKYIDIFYIEDMCNYNIMYDKIMRKVESYFFHENYIVKKKIFYPEKLKLLNEYVLFLNEMGQKIKLEDINVINGTYSYKYIDGKRFDIQCKEEFDYILRHLQFQEKNKAESKHDDEENLINEISYYFEILMVEETKYENVKWKKFLNRYRYNIERLLHKYKSVKSFLSHGDLHNKNILLREKNIFFIDYDEISYAPKNYDLAVFLYRYVNSDIGNLSYEKIRRILDFFSKNEEKRIIEILELYIIKVIFQKKYLEVANKTSLNTWEKDSWIHWSEDFSILENIRINTYLEE